MDKKVLKNIKEYKLTSATQAKYIPILDRDPVFAARALTKKGIIKAYKLLKETFQEIEKENIYHEVLANTLLFSRENFVWFSTLFKELENILREEEFDIPYDKCPTINAVKAPTVYQPFRALNDKGELKLFNF